MATQKQQAALQDIPFELIAELAKQLADVHVRITRRSASLGVAAPGSSYGGWSQIYTGLAMRTVELAQIDGWLRANAGGGEYMVFTFAPDDPVTPRIPAFRVKVEGSPRNASPQIDAAQAAASTPFQSAASNGGGGGGLPPPWAAPFAQPAGGHVQQPYSGYENEVEPPHWAQLPPGELAALRRARDEARGQRRIAYDRSGPAPAPGATVASDQVLQRQVEQLQRQIGDFTRTATAQQEVWDRERKQLEAKLADERERAREERHRGEMGALTAKLDALASARHAPQNGGIDLPGIAAVIAAVAPIVKGDGSQAAVLQTALQAALAPRPDPLSGILEKWGPTIFPMLKDGLGGGSGDRVALLDKMAEYQLASASMTAELIEKFAEDKIGDHPAVELIKQTLESGKQLAVAYFQDRAQEQQRAPQQQQQHVIAAQSTVVHERPAPQPQRTPQQPPQPARTPTAAVPASLEMVFAMLPESMKTHEWQALLTALHQSPPPPAADLAMLLAEHVQHLMAFGMLPQELAGLAADPKAALTPFVVLLPAFQTNRAYVEEVFNRSITLMQQAGLVGGQPAPAAPGPAPAASMSPPVPAAARRPRPAPVAAPTIAAPVQVSGPPDDEDDAEAEDDGDEEGDDAAEPIDDGIQPYGPPS